MKFQIPNSKFQKQRGFTILESIVAILILSLAISGVFASVQTSLSQAIIAKDETQAFYLAQEAFEAIRNTRDQNQLIRVKSNPNHHWLSGISELATDPCYFGKICRVDARAIPPSFNYCGANWDSCPNLRQHSATYLYNHSSGSATNIKREIQIERVSADEIIVIVQVKWTKGALSNTFKVKTHLFNWI